MVKRFGLAVLVPLLLIGCAEEPQPREDLGTLPEPSNTQTYSTPSYTPEEPELSEGLGTPPESSNTQTYSTPSYMPNAPSSSDSPIERRQEILDGNKRRELEKEINKDKMDAWEYSAYEGNSQKALEKNEEVQNGIDELSELADDEE